MRRHIRDLQPHRCSKHHLSIRIARSKLSTPLCYSSRSNRSSRCVLRSTCVAHVTHSMRPYKNWEMRERLGRCAALKAVFAHFVASTSSNAGKRRRILPWNFIKTTFLKQNTLESGPSASGSCSVVWPKYKVLCPFPGYLHQIVGLLAALGTQ